ncbi:MAG: hypothetical protein JXA33_25090 [Anaerolineae bacterium]|nr:hypothetical protein [Anaerolineae bacterium]
MIFSLGYNGGMIPTRLTVPASWRELNITEWRGPIFIFGDNDSGKSTFARYLYTQCITSHPDTPVGFLDTDVGQNSYGLPTTLTLALNTDRTSTFPPQGSRRSRFIGSNTPTHHTAEMLVGLHYLQLFALQTGIETLVIDTSGFIEPVHGGTVLKWAKVDLFRPCTVVALQRDRELIPLLAPLYHSPGVRLINLPVCDAVQPRTREARRAYRANCYRAYFQDAQRLPLLYNKLAVFPTLDFIPGRLAALEDRAGFTLALAIVESANDTAVWLHTPWNRKGRVTTLRLGDLLIDLDTFQDQPIIS